MGLTGETGDRMEKRKISKSGVSGKQVAFGFMILPEYLIFLREFSCSSWFRTYLKKQSQLTGLRPEIYALGILSTKL